MEEVAWIGVSQLTIHGVLWRPFRDLVSLGVGIHDDSDFEPSDESDIEEPEDVYCNHKGSFMTHTDPIDLEDEAMAVVGVPELDRSCVRRTNRPKRVTRPDWYIPPLPVKRTRVAPSSDSTADPDIVDLTNDTEDHKGGVD